MFRKPKRRRLRRRIRMGSESTPDTVRQQEEDAGAMIQSGGGARRRPGSGANPNAKGDAVSFKDLGECKQTAAKSIRLEQRWLAKIEREARGEGKSPFLHVRFLHDDVQPGMTLDWVMIPAHVFQDLLEASRE